MDAHLQGTFYNFFFYQKMKKSRQVSIYIPTLVFIPISVYPNRKSTVINALLGEKILPTGLGHTTDKFVHIQGK